MSTIRERLSDPNERFSPQELYEAFEAIAPEYGYHRSSDLPPPNGAQVETASITIEEKDKDGNVLRNFYHLAPVVIVRPRTQRDSMIAIPSLVDRILADNLSPSPGVMLNAQVIALAQTVIVSPPGLVDRVLASSDDADMGFFMAFFQNYREWSEARSAELDRKKSGVKGKETGSESVSTSEPSTDSFQRVQTG